MPPPNTPLLYFEVAERFLDCACDALALTTCGCPTCRCVLAGAVAWDHCCDGGQLYASVERVYPSDPFPENMTEPAPCGVQLAADLVIGILRCAPTQDNSGKPPSCEKQSAFAAMVFEDAYAIQNAITCCLAALLGEPCWLRSYVVRDQIFVGPEGGCGGSELRFTVTLDDPFCQEP